MTDHGHADQHAAAGDDRHSEEPDRSRWPSAKAMGLGLVLIGAVTTGIAMFLPFVRPFDGLPVLGRNTLFELIGWHVLLPPALIASSGYSAARGKRLSRWLVIGFCGLAGLELVLFGAEKDLRTMHLVGPGGPADSSGPGVLANFAVAIYVAAAGVALATVGALSILQKAGHASPGSSSTGRHAGGEAPSSSVADLQHDPAAPNGETVAGETDSRRHIVGTRWRSAWPLAAAITVVVVTVAAYLVAGRPPTLTPDTSASQSPAKLTPEQTALQGLLLSPEQVSTAMRTTGLVVRETSTTMNNLAAAVPDKACEPIAFPAEAQVYDGSGWTSVVGQLLQEPGNTFRHAVNQAVVSFPSAKEAAAFFTASAQAWPACANRHFDTVQMGTNLGHTSGPVANTNATLSVAQDQDGSDVTYGCQRALTVAGNIVIDVSACALEPKGVDSYAAINIAYEIAAKASLGNRNPPPPAPPTPDTTGPAAPAVTESALDGLLLSPDTLNTAMGTTGLTLKSSNVKMSELDATLSDPACMPVTGALMAPEYAGSGWIAFREQVLLESGDVHPDSVDQGVVLFPSAQDARAFVTASARRWQACSNRQYTQAQAGKPDAVITVGPVVNANGTLSYTAVINPQIEGTREHGGILVRALTATNNIVIDVLTARMGESDAASDAAVNIAHQIAGKVPTT